MAVGATSGVKSSSNRQTSINGRYAVGDTKKAHYIELTTPKEEDEWNAGFDKIDIAPKNGKIDPNELYDYRAKEVKKYRACLWLSPFNWRKGKSYIYEKDGYLCNEKAKTDKWRENYQQSIVENSRK